MGSIEDMENVSSDLGKVHRSSNYQYMQVILEIVYRIGIVQQFEEILQSRAPLHMRSLLIFALLCSNCRTILFIGTCQYENIFSISVF